MTILEMNYGNEIREVNKIIEGLKKKKITERKYKAFNDGILALLESAVNNMKHVEVRRKDAHEKLEEEYIESGKHIHGTSDD